MRIVATISLSCALEMRAQDVAAALHQEGPCPIDFPIDHPLRGLFIDGAVSGPIAARTRISTFVWAGIDQSRRELERGLRRFARFTSGRARFALVDTNNGVHGFEIAHGLLFRRNVSIIFSKKDRTRCGRAVHKRSEAR